MIILQIIFFIISAIAKSECDTIRFKPDKAWWQTEFWLSGKDTNERSWWYKYPLSFMWDGWHLMDSTRNTCLILCILAGYSILWYWWIIITIGLYVIYGLIFEFFYRY